MLMINVTAETAHMVVRTTNMNLFDIDIGILNIRILTCVWVDASQHFNEAEFRSTEAYCCHPRKKEDSLLGLNVIILEKWSHYIVLFLCFYINIFMYYLTKQSSQTLCLIFMNRFNCALDMVSSMGRFKVYSAELMKPTCVIGVGF